MLPENIFKSIIPFVGRLFTPSCKQILSRRNVDNKLGRSEVENQVEGVLDILCQKETTYSEKIKNQCLSFLSNIDEIYTKPSIQEWLTDQKTRNLFIERVKKGLQESHNIDKNDHELCALYTQYTGEASELAKGPIGRTYLYILDSIKSLQNTTQKLRQELTNLNHQELSKELRHGHELIKKGHGELSAKIDALQYPCNSQISTQLIESEVKKTFDLIVLQQPFPEHKTLDELKTLAEQVSSGDFTTVSNSLQAEIFRKLAFLYFNKKDNEQGKKWLNKAKKVCPNLDYTFDDLQKDLGTTENNSEAIIAQASQKNTSEAHEFILNILISHKRDYKTIKEYFYTTFENFAQIKPQILLNFTILLCDNNDFQEALDILKKLPEEKIALYPILLSIRSLIKFTLCKDSREQGIFTSVPLFPKNVRLNDTLDGIDLRLSALDDIVLFLENYGYKLNIPNYNNHMESIKIWIELTHPDHEIRTAQQKKFNESLSETNFLIKHSALAFSYSSKEFFSLEAIEKHLNLQKNIRKLNNQEQITYLLIALHSNSPHKALEMLSDENICYEQIIGKKAFIEIKAQALSKSGQAETCSDYIESQKEFLDEKQANALRLQLNSDLDLVTSYRQAFELTKSDYDRHRLIEVLEQKKQFSEAASHLQYFFDKTPTISDARRILTLLLKDFQYSSAQNFLSRDDVQSLLQAEPSLYELSAWTAYFNDDYPQAESLLEKVPSEIKRQEDILYLQNQIARETGNWELWYSEIVQAQRDKNELTSAKLAHYASLSIIIDAPDNFINEFIITGLRKAEYENDDKALMSLYLLAQRRNLPEEHTTFALFRMHELSQNDGPIKAFSIQEISALIESTQKQQKNIYEQIALGEIPLHLAIKNWNGTLSASILGQATCNQTQYSWNNKTYIPLFSGNKKEVKFDLNTRIALDRSAMLTLHHLGILELTIKSFPKIFIAHNCMTEFLLDAEKNQFHQLSQLDRATKLLSLIARGQLKTPAPLDYIKLTMPDGLSMRLASFIEQAIQCNGYVILAKNEYKTTSNFDEYVDFKNIDCHLSTLSDIIDFIFKEKCIDEVKYNQVCESYKGHIIYEITKKELTKDTHIFLESNTLYCLEHDDLLKHLVNCNKNVYIQQNEADEAHSIKEYFENQQEILKAINSIRKCAREHIVSYNIMPVRSTTTDEEKDISLINLLSIEDLYDTIVVDDRYINKFKNSNKNINLSSLEILNILHESSIISDNCYKEKLQLLRESGVVFVPFHKTEIVEAVENSYTQKGESKELISIFQYISLVGKYSILRYPEEVHFLFDVLCISIKQIKELWASELPKTEIEIKSRYLSKIINLLYICIPVKDKSIAMDAYVHLTMAQVTLAYNGDLFPSQEQQEEYFKFIDNNFILNLGYFNTYIRPNIIVYAKQSLEHCIESFAKEYKNLPLDIIVKHSLACMHPDIKENILQDSDFSQKYNLEKNRTIKLFDRVVSYTSFMDSVRNISNSINILDIDGKMINISASKNKFGNILLSYNRGRMEMTSGCILSVSKKHRQRVLAEIKSNIYFAERLVSKWQPKIVNPLTNLEYWKFYDDFKALPQEELQRISDALQGPCNLESVFYIPQDKETFFALLGYPASKNLDDFIEKMAYHSSKLLKQKNNGGLFLVGHSAIIPSKTLIKSCKNLQQLFPPDYLLSCIADCSSPFTLMLIFDICNELQEVDTQYITVGEQIIKLLLDDNAKTTIIDFEISIYLILSNLDSQNILEGLPLYFCRLSIWAWAGHIATILSHSTFDKVSFLKHLQESNASNILISTALERLESPYWSMRFELGNHILGMLHQRLRASIDAFCPNNPPKEWVDLLIKGGETELLKAQLYSFMATPFTGLSVHYPTLQHIENLIRDIRHMHPDTALGQLEFIMHVCQYSRIFKFSSEDIDSIQLACSDPIIKSSIASSEKALEIIDSLTNIAITHNSHKLAEIIADIISIFTKHKNNYNIIASVYEILNLSAAYNDEKAYKFIEENIFKIATIIDDKDSISTCISMLQKIMDDHPKIRFYLTRPQAFLILKFYSN